VGALASVSAETSRRWWRRSSADIAGDFEREGSMTGTAFAGLLGGFRRPLLEGGVGAASRRWSMDSESVAEDSEHEDHRLALLSVRLAKPSLFTIDEKRSDCEVEFTLSVLLWIFRNRDPLADFGVSLSSFLSFAQFDFCRSN
jgi:hypothetical protein